MNQDEYILVSAQPSETDRSVSVTDLDNQGPRTLLYGYTAERQTFHVYLDGEMIHRFIYTPDYDNPRGAPEFGHWHEQNVNSVEYDARFTWDEGEDLVPNKRLYPNHCDYEFASFMKSNGFYLPLKNWDDGPAGQPRGTFAGAIFDYDRH